eukprot:24695-Pelagococcus_subviridis.AAC.1
MEWPSDFAAREQRGRFLQARARGGGAHADDEGAECGETRRAKSLRIGVHHANVVVRGPV